MRNVREKLLFSTGMVLGVLLGWLVLVLLSVQPVGLGILFGLAIAFGVAGALLIIKFEATP